MNIVQIEEVVKTLVTKTESGDLNQSEFIYELLLAYGHRKQSVTRLRTGERNLARDEANTVFWKRHLYFKVETSAELHGVIDAMRKEARTARHKIRFVIATDFKLLLAIDTKTGDTLDIEFKDLAKKFDFFLPWAGMEKAVYQGENPADVKAAEKLAKLFDEIKADNFNATTVNDPAKLHELNVFLSRLLFCFFAEDTKIFADNQFSDAIASHTSDDGSDLADYLKRLFTVLNQAESERPGLPDYLSSFPYVNGGLFKDDIQIPAFSRKSRKILVECGAELDWSDINPDIFGSMFQAVVHTEQRSNMGQHYTSVPNIMKVIEPLFLNDLYEELDKHQDNQKKLLELQQRIGRIKIFDPACGSGNFLIIAYKELRKLEVEILKRLQELEFEKSGQMFKPFSVIQLSQFYGIEIDDFAHEVAILSLWLTEHQMNVAFKDEFGETLPLLPLKNGGHIIHGNSLRINWERVLKSDENNEVFIIGNPPYLGSHVQTDEQKADLKALDSTLGRIDFISGWFYKAGRLIQTNENCSCSFVSTNSIAQGEQVSILWSLLYSFGLAIKFAHQSFKWTNNAKSNASVIVVIIGLEHRRKKSRKFIFNENMTKEVMSITPYLTEGKEKYISKLTNPIANIPNLTRGSEAVDDGIYLFSKEEKNALISLEPRAVNFFKRTTGSFEFLNGKEQWCLWFDQENLNNLMTVPEFRKRIEAVRAFRLSSKKKATKDKAETPHLYTSIRHVNSPSILVPRVSSENRDYVPFGFLNKDYIVKDSAYAIYDATPEIFSLISSRMHMVWLKTFAGRLKSDMRYSSNLVYNTFPFPILTQAQRELLIASALDILNVRETFPDKTLSQLYSASDMPEALRDAHQRNDELVESIYRKKPFESDEERLEYLFNLYEKMIEEEKNA